MTAWTDKKIEKLKTLWENGISTAEIGKKLGFSKNAIVGKVHRLGLSNRNSPIKNATTKSGESKPKKATASTSVKKNTSATKIKEKASSSASKGESQKRTASHKKAKSSVPERGVPLKDLAYDRCCWPLDDSSSSEFLFCGQKVFKNKPYCLDHCIIAYTTTVGQNAAEKGQNPQAKENPEEKDTE